MHRSKTGATATVLANRPPASLATALACAAVWVSGPGSAAPKEPVVLKLEGDIEGVHDPVIIKQKDTYYVFCTGGGRGGGGIIPIRTSKDLVHWSEQQFVPVMTNETTTVNVWAPEIFYDDAGKQFIIIWASP